MFSQNKQWNIEKSRPLGRSHALEVSQGSCDPVMKRMEEAACRAGAGISATVLAQHIGEPGLNPQSCREEGKKEGGRKRDRGTRPEVSPSLPPTQAKARFSCSEDHQNGSEGKGGEFQALLPPEFILGVPRDRPRKRCTALWGSLFPVLAQPSTLTKTWAAKQPFKLKLKKSCGRYFKTEACFKRAETEKKGRGGR